MHFLNFYISPTLSFIQHWLTPTNIHFNSNFSSNTQFLHFNFNKLLLFIHLLIFVVLPTSFILHQSSHIRIFKFVSFRLYILKPLRKTSSIHPHSMAHSTFCLPMLKLSKRRYRMSIDKAIQFNYILAPVPEGYN